MKLPCFFPLRWLLIFLAAIPADGLRAQGSARAGFSPSKLKELNQAVADAVQRKEIPGAVVLLERRGKRWGNEFGCRCLVPETKPMVTETVFDMASLTKVMATAPAVMLLVEDGKLDVDAPASRWLPEFTGDGKEKITIRQMLTHVSGLRPGIPHDGWEGYAAGVARAMVEPLQTAPGTEFRYSDLNFILLGEIVRRASGEGLDAFVLRRIYQPLAMEDTRYRPPAIQKDRIAPTTLEGNVLVHGVVHDPTSRRMGGVAGHAGLFSSARDTGRFCRMLLDKGKSPSGTVVMKPETVKAMTEWQAPLPGGVRRTLGFDAQSGFSDCRGAHFGGKSYGHTGWTGVCFWIDPEADAYYVLLANRNHPDERRSMKNLRWQVSTLAAEAMRVAKHVMSGTDRVLAGGLAALEGKKIGLITNQTGLASEGTTTLQTLQKIPGAKVQRLFSPEHGFAGKLDEDGIKDSVDPASGLPVTSLYGQSRKPSPESLAGLDVLVFDIQDVGTRFYTYISTMRNSMEAAAAAGLGFVVLDRVNPLGGMAVEGPLPLDVADKNKFVACHSLPIRHGLTTGELARLFVKESFPGLALSVVPVERWERRFFFSQTLAPWVNPSPNMRSPEAALLYPGIGLLEFSNLSVGRGTDLPFGLLGAPWINAEALVRRLREAKIPGVRIEPATFKPNASVFAHETCHGIQLSVADPRVLRPVRLGIAIAQALYAEHGETYQLDKVNTLLFHTPTLQAIRAGNSLDDITASWKADEAAFRARREEILLYPVPAE